MPADPQREKVYAAEDRTDRGAQLRSAEEVRAYVRAVTASDWWLEHGWPPDVRVHVTSSRQRPKRAQGGWGACAGYFVRFPSFETPDAEAQVAEALDLGLRVPDCEYPWAWCERVIAHELAHVARVADRPNLIDSRHELGAHGPLFCQRYLELAAAVGLDADALALAFQVHGVEFVEPRIAPPADPLSAARLLALRVQVS